jgi:hypothetical protein
MTHLKSEEDLTLQERHVCIIGGWDRATRQFRYMLTRANCREPVVRVFF